MAKSLFEPKKIVRYANNQQLIEGGLGAAPVPPIAPSATRAVPKTASIPASAQNVSSPAPVAVAPPQVTVTPAPVKPAAETRSFLFDGATELRAEFPGSGNSKYGTAMLTFTPHWSQETTGSFALYTIGTSGSNDYRVEISIERTSGSAGYSDKLSYKTISGSDSIQTLTPLATSPNTYSGSVEGSFLQVHHNTVFMGNAAQGKSRLDNGKTYVYGEGTTYIDRIAEFTGSLHDISVGGLNSGSEHFFSGSIDQFVWINSKNYVMPRNKAQRYDSNLYLKAYYKFEGIVSASKGNNFTVVGTETYVSSSI